MPVFYRDIHNLWMQLYATLPDTVYDVQHEYLWNNMYITSNNKPMYWKEWKNKGISKIRDILTDNGQFLDNEEIEKKINIKCNFLQALMIRQSIPFAWRETIKHSQVKLPVTESLYIKLNGVRNDIKNLNVRTSTGNLLTSVIISQHVKKKWIEMFPQ